MHKGRYCISTVAAITAVLLLAGTARAVIGDSQSKHNMTEIPGYGFGNDVCAACHKPHYSMDKRTWTSDKDVRGDGLRNLTPARAASLDAPAAGIYLCLDCHSSSSSAPSWSEQPGYAAARVSTHSTKEMQASGYVTKYPSFTAKCGDCHDVHKRWTGTYAGTNIYMVMSTIQTPNSGVRGTTFTAMSGGGSMGTGSNRSICEVCHTQTTYHRNNGGAAHNNGQNCTHCHKHSGGFAGTACDKCHGDPPKGVSTLVGGSANPGSTKTGSATAGTHAYHVYSTYGGTTYGCKLCHRGGMGDTGAQDKVIEVRFWGFGVSTSGSFAGFAPISGYTFSPNNTTGGTLQCSNTYCHGNFTGGIATNRPAWNNKATGACGTCHPTSPPALLNHSVHITAAWGPLAACDDCHPAGSQAGRHAGHVDGAVTFKDGSTLAATTVCNRCHGCKASTKPTWGDSSKRGQTAWCEGCHNGLSTVNTAAGTGGKDVAAPNVVGGTGYGYDVTGHGKTGAALACTACHAAGSPHIDQYSPTYRSSLGNYQAGYRLVKSNTVPLLGGYSTTRIGLCFSAGCHIENRVLGTAPGGKVSFLHVHSIPIPVATWYTNFRNMTSTGNYDVIGNFPDVPTNIHWEHMDDFGSTKRGALLRDKIFDSDGDRVGDSYVTCETCHNAHGTRQPAMVFDEFSIKTYSVLVNQSMNYAWLGNDGYTTTRCTRSCHSSGDAEGTAGTRWYRAPTSLSTVFGVPVGVKAVLLP